ncbi:MAG: PmoA family protein [Verrucomicrobiae bacterium]|nr:PmoA family protein [Verrucomicrobiae bacterium]
MKTGCILLRAAVALLPLGANAARFDFFLLNDRELEVREGEQRVFVYNFGVQLPPNVPPQYACGAFVHPLYGPDGEVLTDAFPADHYHHRGIFWAWPHVRSGDQDADLWQLKGVRQEFERWLCQENRRGCGLLGVQNAWRLGGRKVAEEQVWFRIWPATRDGRAIDVELILKAVDAPLTLRGAEGKSYGGLSVRFAPRAGAPAITVPGGRSTNDLLVTRLAWADYSARFGAQWSPSGITVMVAPQHPDYPPEWMTRHYGALCVGWPGVQARTIPAGESVRLRYRLWVHRGAPEAGELQGHYKRFAEDRSNLAPLAVEVWGQPRQ